MSKAEANAAVLAPQETHGLLGHGAAETALLDAYRSGRMPHAWLIGGAIGIGKATLAYRAARFILEHPDAQSALVQTADDFAIDPASHTAALVASRAHGNLFVLERTVNDKGTLRTMVAVDQVRDAVSFFGATAAVEGWRICIVDTVDEMNASSANALLKILEEPPPRALFFLVSHAPARLLPTILSRCRRLSLRPLQNDSVAEALARALGQGAPNETIREAAALADGSVGRAFAMLDGKSAKLNARVAALLSTLPQVDGEAMHALGDLMPLTDRVALAAFVAGVERWIESQIHHASANGKPDLPRLARLAEVWDKIGRAARDAEAYNLERKPLVFSSVAMLAEAMA